ncbi:hypothetical protein HDU91_001007 [Kappamyces sp. JEL0680]|nr:hypothetical protein HDU91_001007 [Kappamyces sp. JEL0680]
MRTKLQLADEKYKSSQDEFRQLQCQLFAAEEKSKDCSVQIECLKSENSAAMELLLSKNEAAIAKVQADSLLLAESDKAQILGLERDLASTKSLLQHLEKQTDGLKQDLKEKDGCIIELQTSCAIKETESAQHANEKAELEGKLKFLNETLAILNEQVKQLESESAALKQEKTCYLEFQSNQEAAWKAQIQTLSDGRKLLEETISGLEEKLARQEDACLQLAVELAETKALYSANQKLLDEANASAVSLAGQTHEKILSTFHQGFADFKSLREAEDAAASLRLACQEAKDEMGLAVSVKDSQIDKLQKQVNLLTLSLKTEAEESSKAKVELATAQAHLAKLAAEMERAKASSIRQSAEACDAIKAQQMAELNARDEQLVNLKFQKDNELKMMEEEKEKAEKDRVSRRCSPQDLAQQEVLRLMQELRSFRNPPRTLSGIEAQDVQPHRTGTRALVTVDDGNGPGLSRLHAKGESHLADKPRSSKRSSVASRIKHDASNLQRSTHRKSHANQDRLVQSNSLDLFEPPF